MAWGTSPVQEAKSNAWDGVHASITITVTAPTDGNFGVIYFDAAASSLAVTSITQTGATWTSAIVSQTARDCEIWYTSALFSSAGTTITVNLAGSPGANGTQSAEFSEWVPPSSIAVDATGGNSGTSTTPTTATITPTASKNALIIGAIRAGAAVSAGPTGGFTALTSADSSVRGFGGYLVAASTSGSYSTSWSGSSGLWESAIAAFIDNSGGASTLVRRTLGDLGTRAGSRQAM